MCRKFKGNTINTFPRALSSALFRLSFLLAPYAFLQWIGFYNFFMFCMFCKKNIIYYVLHVLLHQANFDLVAPLTQEKVPTNSIFSRINFFFIANISSKTRQTMLNLGGRGDRLFSVAQCSTYYCFFVHGHVYPL
jgi:hypothetical protein